MNLSPTAIGILLAGLAASAVAQTAQSPSAPTGNSNPPAAQPQTLLHAESNMVLLDVVVTEKEESVHGIDRSRFHVFEDGREQNISSFEEHSAAQQSRPTVRPPLPPHYYNNLPSQAPGSAINVLLLDALNTPLANQVDVRRQMLKYLETIEPGTTLAIFTLSSRLRMVQGFTSSAGELINALKSASANARQSTALDSPSGSAFDSAVGNLQLMGDGAALASLQDFQQDVNSFQTDQRVRITLEAMQQLARYLGAVPVRKNLIWFSGSFPIDIGPTSISDPSSGSRYYAAELRNTSEMLAAARVAVYPMAAEGLATPASFNLNVNESLRPSVPTSRGNEERFTLEDIADQTGGKALYNNNGFARAVANAVENGSSYYTIGYVPQSKDFHGQFRKFKVRIDDCKCQLAYRSGYYADPPGKAASTGIQSASILTAATLHGAPPATQVLFQARVLPESDPAVSDAHLPNRPIGEMAAALKPPLHRYVIDLAVDPRTIEFETSAKGERQMALEFALIACDADGKRVNYVDRNTQLALPPDRYAQLLASGLPVRLALEVPAGRNFLIIAVHDRIASRVGSLEIPLTVPAK